MDRPAPARRRGSITFVTFQYDPTAGFAEQVETLWRATIAALLTYPDRDQNYWLKSFPRESCELSAWVIGSMLLDYEYGDWTLVCGSIDTDKSTSRRTGAHAWLELRDQGQVCFSLDATADQFPEWCTEPFLVEGASLLTHHFTDNYRASLISEPLEWHRDRFHLPPLEFVRASIRG